MAEGQSVIASKVNYCKEGLAVRRYHEYGRFRFIRPIIKSLMCLNWSSPPPWLSPSLSVVGTECLSASLTEDPAVSLAVNLLACISLFR